MNPISDPNFKDEINKLDNPVWFSLTETQSPFAVGNHSIKFYRPEYCPFGGFDKFDGIREGIDEYSRTCENFFVVGEMPEVNPNIKLVKELVCDQMIHEDLVHMNYRDEIVELSWNHSYELFQLVNLVQPGYFREKTHLMGNYFGIFKNEKLVAVTGERMQMNRFIEVSAVVTHPNHVGKGYAKQLVAYTVNNVFRQNKIPFLHVAETNTKAIELYQNLGFSKRRKISFWNLALGNRLRK